LTINSVTRTLESPLGETLLDLLRRENYKSVKLGCNTGDCGTCAVLLDGRAVNACMLLAAACAGRSIVTVEGLETDGRLHPLQEASLESGAVQCGFCTPGMIVAAIDLLRRKPDPSEQEIREGLAGNLCRCTGYAKQVTAVQMASRKADADD
jgi:aerobic-type carbon monoxide dehydrogenase small subunit (CoxS/CutS family)